MPVKLWNKNFILLWQGQFVSMAGSQLSSVALMLWLLDETGSATLMGLLMMAGSIPGVILGPMGGTIADRYSRKWIIVVADFLKGMFIIGFAAVVFFIEGGTQIKLILLFMLSIGSGIVSAFFGPAISAALPDLVPRDRLSSANSLVQASGQIASLIGQAVGGIFYRVAGAAIIFVIDGITYFFSGASVTFIELKHEKKEMPAGWLRLFQTFTTEMLEGFHFAWGNVGIRSVVMMAALLNFFIAPIFVLMPLFVKDFLNVKADWYGYILAGIGLGSLTGFIIAGTVKRTGKKRVGSHLAALVAFSAGFVVIGLVKSAPVCLGVMFFIGMMVGILQVDFVTLLQMGVPTEIRGRVFGFLGTLSAGLMPIAMGLSGIVADLTGQNIPAIYLTCGILMVVISLVTTTSGAYRSFLAME